MAEVKQLKLQQIYKEKAVPALMKELGCKNIMQVPSIKKIVVNAGIGDFRGNKEAVEGFVNEFADISGQAPSPRKARKSESGFKIRQGDVVGYAVTLRGARMWAFLDKLINVVIPRVRDFRGLDPKALDKGGNYSIGIKEHTLFPEVNANTTKGVRSLQVTIVTTANNAEESKKLLDLVGLPFKKEGK
jgi:large subunit ribosomal protein L5